MENLQLLRVDDRLIHGQVMTAWIKQRPAKEIVIIDDLVVKDDFTKAVLEMAAPRGVKVRIFDLQNAFNFLENGLKEKTIILVKSPFPIKELLKKGIEFNEVIIGGMGMNSDRKKLYKNISASDEEKEIFKEISERGIDVNIQIVPSDRAIPIKSVL